MSKPSSPFGDYFLLNVNPVIRYLILSNVIWGGALGLLGPIFALFVVGFVEGGSAAVAGLAATIYLITKSLAQVPFASLADRIRGERDDFWLMFGGGILSAFVPLLYLIVSTPLQLYLVQFLYGLVIAATFPTYMAIFTRHIDKQKEGTEWGVFFMLSDFSAAIAASVGGILAQTVGFPILIVVSSVVTIVGVGLMYPIRRHMKKTA